MTDLTIFRKCTNFKQSYCFIKVHWSIKNFVKLKETQLFYLVIKLTKAVVSAWQNFKLILDCFMRNFKLRYEVQKI